MTFDEWWADDKNWKKYVAERQFNELAEAAWEAGAGAAHESRDLELAGE